MTLIDFLVLCLAASAIVDVWFNGSIFAGWRAMAEALDDGGPADQETIDEIASDLPELPLGWSDRWMCWIPSRGITIMLCRYCFSHHTPWVVALTCFVPGLFIADPWATLLKFPAYCLAATRLGNIINAYVPDTAKYQRERSE